MNKERKLTMKKKVNQVEVKVIHVSADQTEVLFADKEDRRPTTGRRTSDEFLHVRSQ